MTLPLRKGSERTLCPHPFTGEGAAGARLIPHNANHNAEPPASAPLHAPCTQVHATCPAWQSISSALLQGPVSLSAPALPCTCHPLLQYGIPSHPRPALPPPRAHALRRPFSLLPCPVSAPNPHAGRRCRVRRHLPIDPCPALPLPSSHAPLPCPASATLPPALPCLPPRHLLPCPLLPCPDAGGP